MKPEDLLYGADVRRKAHTIARAKARVTYARCRLLGHNRIKWGSGLEPEGTWTCWTCETCGHTWTFNEK